MIKFALVLTVVFVILKATDTVKWKWLWVLSPMWITLILLAFVFFVMLFIVVFIQ